MQRPLMRKVLPLAAALAGACWAAGPAHAVGKVEVNFLQPEKYVDAGRFGIDRDRTLRALGDYLQSLGKELPDGQTLTLEVLDIDLAGTLEPIRAGEIRVMRDRADWPHIKLRYTLLAGNDAAAAPLKSGTADLSDMNYMQSLRGLGLIDGEYGYEKRMLLQWFRQKLLAP